MHRIYSFVLISSLLILFSIVGLSEPIKVVTEEFPPYNYVGKNGVIEGQSTEVVKAVFERVGYPFKPQLYPWARSLNTAKKEPNTLIYSIGRNADRESSFKWVGIIAPANSVLYALAERTDIQLNNIEDAKPFTVTTIRDDIRHQYLKNNGFIHKQNLQLVNKYEQGLKMLLAGRTDLWAANEFTAMYLLKKKGFRGDSGVRTVLKLTEVSAEGYYMAFSADTSDEVVDKFRKALLEIKNDGTYDRIIKQKIKEL